MKKKTASIIIVSVFILSCVSKRNKKFESPFHPDSVSLNTTVSLIKEDPQSVFDRLLDSANSFKVGDSLPAFLYNHLLDYEYPWLTDHRDISIRRLIIDSTENNSLLKAIFNSSDLRLKKIADSSEVSRPSLLSLLPDRNLSNYDLVVRRLATKQ